MGEDIRATGQVDVILVLNMKRFIQPSDERSFESARGSKAFADELRNRWEDRLKSRETFSPIGLEVAWDSEGDPQIPVEKIGFLTGAFRQLLLEDYFTPAYFLHKERMLFPKPLQENFQFKKLFVDVWKHWNVFIRPTTTGMFVIRLNREYREKPKPLLEIATDVIQLQMSFDIPGAHHRLHELKKQITSDRATLQSKEESINKFLQWLGESGHLDYAPVQWQLAMEVCREFVRDLIGIEETFAVQLPNGVKFHFWVPEPSISVPLHDSYVIYQFDELIAPPYLLKDNMNTSPASHILVHASDIQRSRAIGSELVCLIEGAMLRHSHGTVSGSETARRFPTHQQDYIDEVLKNNLASWEDELCLLTPRVALLYPSFSARRDELYVSTLPAITSRIDYLSYWEAIKRMIEFALEVRVLAQLVERSSATVLQELTGILRQIRSDVISENFKLNIPQIFQLISDAANLSRLVSLCQGLSNPHIWSRAEYACKKASRLIELLGISVFMEHSQRNVNNITDLINHIDELHLAALSDRSNKQAFWITTGISALSLAIIVFSLPSFWADIYALNYTAIPKVIPQMLPSIFYIGTIFVFIAMFVALILAILSFWRSLKALGKTPQRALPTEGFASLRSTRRR